MSIACYHKNKLHEEPHLSEEFDSFCCAMSPDENPMTDPHSPLATCPCL